MTDIIKTETAAPAKTRLTKASLADLSASIQGSLNASGSARQAWVDSMVTAAVASFQARGVHKNDMTFGQWWDSQDFIYNGKPMTHQERAALIAIGQSEAAARHLFENTERRSLRMMHTHELDQARIAVGLRALTDKRHGGRNSITPPKHATRLDRAPVEAAPVTPSLDDTERGAAEDFLNQQAQGAGQPQTEFPGFQQAEGHPEAQPMPEDIWTTLREALRPRQQEILIAIENAGGDGISKEELIEAGHEWATTKHFDTNIAPLFMRGLIFALRPGHLVAAVCLPLTAANPAPSAPFDEDEFKLLRACVHPDGGAGKDRLTRAFNLLDERKALLVG